MRIILAFMTALLLSGCADYDFAGMLDSPTQSDLELPAQAAVHPNPAAPSGIDAHCRAVARQRTEDAAANGANEEFQRDIRNGTYADCVEWATKHAM